ncbi:hypothetical protein GGU10DRAFT_405811 [Lentinula aff. detonsa]|uniref:Uncharacterized protein n=1 Tax=Lentinula aff. detonsa TaxID=2804958 RepID=A0AA38NKF1_9AGAR|nr:hypothetical protein GGU10DRAFT_405811 [Lentinula aff. detonsa]
MINTILETFPFIGTVLISQIHENSGWIQLYPWVFGNAVVLQTMPIALLALWHIYGNFSESHIAVGTGFGQRNRYVNVIFLDLEPLLMLFCNPSGQVGGVAISSTIFQWKLDGALRKRIDGPDVEQVRCLCQ